MKAPLPDPLIPPEKLEGLRNGDGRARPPLLTVFFVMTWLQVFIGYFLLHHDGNLQRLAAERPLDTVINLIPVWMLLPAIQYFLWIGKNRTRQLCLVAEGLAITLAGLNYFGTTGEMRTPGFDYVKAVGGVVGIVILTHPSVTAFYRTSDEQAQSGPL